MQLHSCVCAENSVSVFACLISSGSFIGSSYRCFMTRLSFVGNKAIEVSMTCPKNFSLHQIQAGFGQVCRESDSASNDENCSFVLFFLAYISCGRNYCCFKGFVAPG